MSVNTDSVPKIVSANISNITNPDIIAALLSAHDLGISNDKVLVVNAASAKTPGGRPFGTGTAAEESLCKKPLKITAEI